MSNHALGMSYICNVVSGPHTSLLQIFRWQHAACSKDAGIRGVKLNRACAVEPREVGRVSADLRTINLGHKQDVRVRGGNAKINCGPSRPHGGRRFCARKSGHVRAPLAVIYAVLSIRTISRDRSLKEKKSGEWREDNYCSIVPLYDGRNEKYARRLRLATGRRVNVLQHF